MSEICESIIDDFLSGNLSRKDLEEGLTSVFQVSNTTSVQAQDYLHKLFSDKKVDAEAFKLLSETVSNISIKTTLSSGKVSTDISYFNEDKTLHLTDLPGNEGESTNSSDQTVIIRTDTASPVTDYSVGKSSTDNSDSAIQSVSNEAKAASKKAAATTQMQDQSLF